MKFEIDAGWWRKNKPKVMKASGLGKSLDLYKKKEAEFKKKVPKAGSGGRESIEKSPYLKFIEAFDALEQVDSCRKKALKNAGKVHKDIASALKQNGAIIQRQKMLRSLMSDGIKKDVLKRMAYYKDLESEIKLVITRQKALLEIKKKADSGDVKAKKVFGKGVRTINESIMKVGEGPQRLYLVCLDLWKLIEKLPGDFSGHKASVKGIIGAARKLDKAKKPIIEFARDYGSYAASD